MALYSRDSKLSEAIMSHPSLIPVVTRLGVTLGVGDATVERICDSRGIDADFFLSVINTFIDEDYFPADPWGSFSLEKTIDYLRKTSTYYSRVQLPNIDRHFSILVERSGDGNNIDMLRKFYFEMRAQLAECLEMETGLIFPSISKGERIPVPDLLSRRYEEVEEKLHDLLLFFVEHLHGDYDSNLCTAVVSAVFSLERDLCQNNRIRTRILLPILREKQLL